jgi:signal peptidase
MTSVPDTHHSIPRQLANGAGWAVAIALAALALAVAVPLAFGDRPFTVLTGSMEPTIAAGDVVIEERISPLEARLGDVVTFKDPEDQGRLLTHRVRSIRRDGPFLRFVTQGDANNTVEHWRIPLDGQLGRVLYAIPWVGHLTVLTQTRTGLLLILFVPLLLLGMDELRRIWRPRGGRAVDGVG